MLSFNWKTYSIILQWGSPIHQMFMIQLLEAHQESQNEVCDQVRFVCVSNLLILSAVP